MVIISHPTGNANVRAAVAGLADADLLSGFYTAIASFPGSTLDRLGGIKSLSEIRRRRFESRLQPFVKTWPWWELGRLLSAKAGLAGLTRNETGIFSVDAVYHSIDRRLTSQLTGMAEKVNAVYAYEDGAMYTFREAKRLGLKCLYDLPIGYWRTSQRLLGLERERWPEWGNTMRGLTSSETKLSRKEEELKLADRIFVASSFTGKTLKDYPGRLGPVEVIPYGFPAVNGSREYEKISGRPLRLLFVGGLSQRKGIADMFAAVDKLGDAVSLTVVGRKATEDCAPLNAALAKHKWIPSLPHAEILKTMRAHDVLLFPSLFEGFGLVITEAMSQGTPVITTDRTAGPDLITNGENGWLIEAGSTESLYNTITGLVHAPDQIAKAGLAAMEKARSRPWEVYGKELATAILKA
ncbi:glycosyltransferase family 4 protein [Chitinophaga tropicalis]|uniref:Glycosyltransferase n=1 Tax=Chitinophaga tropicalis TaxID=2683588 RepID=A0A7K1UBS6_9BACT|nr:glycosyltransferase family 4 protein [Chitinophaga tropicalis]MVT11720.1 glycosyltransferase [Chitinophaga tropicalis]